MRDALPPLRIGIAGLGTVGAGVIRLLRENREGISARAGRTIEVVAVCARDRTRDRGIDLSGIRWHDDAASLAADPDLDVVVELIGGAEGAAREAVEGALSRGTPVVSANKALLALHGASLSALSARHEAPLLFEAAVAGGVPAIKLVREGLAGDRLLRVGGILNGTCNYILTTMRETGRAFADVLADAQALGYAEADPSTDVDGWDAAHKLAILAALSFGRPVAFETLHVEGIRDIQPADLHFADELGFRIKLLGLAREGEAGLEAWMRPCLVPKAAPIAGVEGVFNALLVEGEFAGSQMIEGRGAGAGPTAVAVVADLIDLARGARLPVWGVAQTCTPARCVERGQLSGAYYLRLDVQDRPGVIAEIATILSGYGVSLRGMVQHGEADDARDTDSVAIALLTHRTSEQAMLDTISRIEVLPSILGRPLMLRIEAG